MSPETSPLRARGSWKNKRAPGILERCDATRELLLSTAVEGEERSAWCREQVEDLCRKHRNQTIPIGANQTMARQTGTVSASY